MKFNRNGIFWTWMLFLVSGVVFKNLPDSNSWTNEFAIFDVKIAIVLMAVYLSTENTNENSGG